MEIAEQTRRRSRKTANQKMVCCMLFYHYSFPVEWLRHRIEIYTIPPKERVQSTPSETLLPTLLIRKLGCGSKSPTSSALHSQCSPDRSSGFAQTLILAVISEIRYFAKKVIPCTKTRGSRGNHRSCPA